MANEMPLGLVQLWGYRCRCGYVWLSKSQNPNDDLPGRCPRCECRTWDTRSHKVRSDRALAAIARELKRGG